MATYAKTLAALLGAVGTWLATAFEDGAVAPGEWGGLLIAVGTVVAVWGIPNTVSSTDDG